MSGFWRFTNNYGSRVASLLDAEQVSLPALLDEPDTVPELLASNVKLAEYLRQESVLEQLVALVVEEDKAQRDMMVSDGADGVEPSNEGSDELKEQISDETCPDGEPFHEHDNGSNKAKDANADREDDEGDEDEEDEEGDSSLQEPEAETETEIHTRRAQVAVEILSIDVWSITDTFMECTSLLQQLWSILDQEAPLSISSASYFMKINEHLLDMKTPEMVHFILKEPRLVQRFVRHIETPPLMDFMLKVISTDKPDSSSGVIEVLKEQNLIEELIEYLSPNHSSSIQSAASDFLKAFITISANNAENTTIGPNELSRELVSEKIVRNLLANMIKGGTGLSNGVGIIIEIIRKNNSDYDPIPVVYVNLESHPPSPRDPIYLGTLVKIFSDAIPLFTEMLQKTSNEMLETPFGTIEPLGFERFKICELIAELIHCSNMQLLNEKRGEEIVKERDHVREVLIAKHQELKLQCNEDDEILNEDEIIINEINKLDLNRPDKIQELENLQEDQDEKQERLMILSEEQIRENPMVGDLLKISLYDNEIIIEILKMFFKFPWNNFLHNVVFDIVQQILNAPMDLGFNKFLAVDLFDRCNITQLIIDGNDTCIQYENENGLRLGYMGHLTLIAEEVVKFINEKSYHTDPKASLIDESVNSEQWNIYKNEVLEDIRAKYNSVLGSDGQQMNEHDMELFQKYYGNYQDGEEEEEEEEEEEDDDHDDEEEDAEDNDEDLLNSHHSSNTQYEANQHQLDGANNNVNNNDDDEENITKKYFNSSNKGTKYDDEEEEDEDDDEISWSDNRDVVESEIGGHPYHEMSAGGLDDDLILAEVEEEVDGMGIEDDYEDPNDDGMSYEKANHPLYQSDGSLRSMSAEEMK